LFQPDAGIVRADRAVRAFVRSAADHGAEVVEHSRVVRLDVGESGVGVETDGERFEAPVAVVTAGAWAPNLLARAGYELEASPSGTQRRIRTRTWSRRASIRTLPTSTSSWTGGGRWWWARRAAATGSSLPR